MWSSQCELRRYDSRRKEPLMDTNGTLILRTDGTVAAANRGVDERDLGFRRWRMIMRYSIWAACGVGVAASLVGAEIKLPEEKARLVESKLPGYAMATTYCYTCHSTDY